MLRLNPELEIADGEKDALGLLPAIAPILFEASGERLFLLVGLELRQQKRMADADLLAVKGIDHYGSKLGQLQPASHIRGRFARSSLRSAQWSISVLPSSAERGSRWPPPSGERRGAGGPIHPAPQPSTPAPKSAPKSPGMAS